MRKAGFLPRRLNTIQPRGRKSWTWGTLLTSQKKLGGIPFSRHRDYMQKCEAHIDSHGAMAFGTGNEKVTLTGSKEKNCEKNVLLLRNCDRFSGGIELCGRSCAQRVAKMHHQWSPYRFNLLHGIR